MSHSKVNHCKLHKKSVAVVFLLLALFGSSVGANNDYCTKQTGRFLEFIKNNNSDSAVRCFHRMLYSCTGIKDAQFVQALACYKTLLNKAITTKDTAGVHQYIDSLSVVYKYRAKMIGAYQAHYEDYIGLVLRVCPSKTRLAYQATVQYLAETADTGSNNMILQHVRTAIAAEKRGTLNQSVLLESFYRARKMIDQRIAKRPKDQANVELLKEVNKQFEKEAKIDCSSLNSFVSSNYESVSHDTLSLKVLAWMLTVKCPDSEQFSVTLLQLSELVKASSLFADIARNFVQQERTEKAQEYFKKAINLEINKLNKAQYYLELAQASKSNPEYAYEQCKRAIQCNPHLGSAWLLMANLVSDNARKCSGFGQKALFCLATAQCVKAKAAEPQLSATANKQISLYSAKLPTASDLEQEKLAAQQQYQLQCWPNETVTIKTKP